MVKSSLEKGYRGLIMGPGKGCEETEISAERIPVYVSDILRRYGHEVDPEDITTPDGDRLAAYNLERGIAIEGIKRHRREIGMEIKERVGIKVTFV